MNNMLRKACLGSFVVCCLPLVAMARTHTLADLSDAAVQNRDVIRSYEIQMRQAETGIREERAAFLPRVDAGYTLNRLDESSALENEENGAWQIAAKLNLFAGFKDQSHLVRQKRATKIREVLLDSLEQDIRLETALGLLSVYRTRADLDVAETAYKLYQKEYENARLQHAVGVIRKADLLKFKVVMDNAAQDQSRALAAVDKAVNRLSRTTGVALSAASLDFGAFAVLPDLGTYETLAPRMLAEKSELRILDLSKEMAEDSVIAAKSAYYPQADVSLSYGERADDYGVSDNREEETRLQLTFGVNLFHGMKKPAVVERARLERDRFDHERNETVQDLETRLKNLLLDARVAKENLAVAKASVAEAKEHLRVSEFSYRQGIATATDLLDAIFYLSRARANHIVAINGYFDTVLRIRRLVAGFRGDTVAGG